MSDLTGALSVGASMTAQLTMTGVHTITLTAAASDGNVDVATITLTLVP